MKYVSASTPEQVRVALETSLASRGFALARRETDFDWWSDQRTEMGISVLATHGGRCQAEVIHVTGFE